MRPTSIGNQPDWGAYNCTDSQIIAAIKQLQERLVALEKRVENLELKENTDV